ncbi:MAG: CoA transferase [Chloroflexi bacterium]|nr:CoA transferase [Chloroflexota bacterium]MDA1145909.1 CoA transferase [Chloroflexota bacterium]
MADGALSGIRVLDLTQGSFNYAGRLLAGLGADVIKVEPPEGDAVRAMPPFPDDKANLETSARHLHLNAGKRSVVLDLDTAEGCESLRRLAATSDALIESFEVGYLGERGLGYDDLVGVKPDLVMASVTHFGQDGPYAGYAGGEIVDVALGGYLKLTGDADREPVKPYDDLVLTHASLHTAAAVMAGLTHRDATGEGDYFDVAAIDAAMFLLGGVAQIYEYDREIPVRRGARLMFSNPQYPYPSTIRPCMDGYVHAHSNNRNADLLAALMPGMGIEDFLDAPMGNADEIDARMDAWMADKDKFEVVRRAQELRLPFTEVLTPAEILSDPHLEAREFIVELNHPAAPEVRQPGGPAKLSATPWRNERAPLLGEHTDEVLSTLTEAKPQPTPTTTSAGGSRKPLAGMRVLELSTAVAGPVAGCVLADMGAEVIKIEAPSARTAAQSKVPPPLDGVPDRPYNRTPFFNELHRGKRHASIDLASPEGRELFLKAVATADVVLENFSPRVLGNLGIDFDDLRAVKPDIILTSMPAFGKSGPYMLRGSYGPGIDAMSGMSHLTGYPDRGPGKPAQFYLDQNAGLTAALTTMAALRHRNRTGEGQYIELSMLEGELQLVAPALLDVTMNGRVPSRIGNRHAWHAPQGVYRCAGDDEWLALGIATDEQWRALASAIGRPELAEDARFTSEAGRHECEDELDAAIEAWTASRNHLDAMRELQAAGVPAGAVLDVAEVHGDAQFAHRETLAWVDHPEIGRFPHTRTAWRSRLGHHGVSGPAPAFGDGNALLLEIAGLGAGARERLVAAGVMADAPGGGGGS